MAWTLINCSSSSSTVSSSFNIDIGRISRQSGRKHSSLPVASIASNNASTSQNLPKLRSSPSLFRTKNNARFHRPIFAQQAKGDKAEGEKAKAGVKSIVCSDCDGNGAKLCTQCEGSGVNSVDHFNGRFKAGQICWLCRGKREILCGNCNGAGFLGGFMSTFDE